MLRGMTIMEFRERQAFYELEPYGPLRDNYHAAIIAKMVADVHGARKTSDKAPFTYEDFLLKFGEHREPAPATQTWQQKFNIAKMIASAFNTKGKDMESA